MNCVGGTESLALAGINSQVTNEVMRIAELAQLCCKASASRRLLGTLVPSSEQPCPFCDCWNAAGSRSDAVRAEQSPQSSQCLARVHDDSRPALAPRKLPLAIFLPLLPGNMFQEHRGDLLPDGAWMGVMSQGRR